MEFRLGIDLGGSKTEVLVLDPAGQAVFRQRVATPAHSYAAILELLVGLVRQVEIDLDLSPTVGIGIPGAISPATGLLRNSNTVCLNGRPFQQDFEGRLGRAVRVENDANCLTLSEALGGVARDYPVVFGVIIGTGTGGGLVVDRKLRRGPHAIGGEWGHNPLPWQRSIDGSRACYCGKDACIETFLSGPGLAANFQARFGKVLSSHEIIAGAAVGDDACCAMMALYHDQMARSLAHLINILDPQAIVLGGGMSNIDSIYQAVPRLLGKYVFSDFVATPILQAERGDASGVYGAALLWD